MKRLSDKEKIKILKKKKNNMKEYKKTKKAR